MELARRRVFPEHAGVVKARKRPLLDAHALAKFEMLLAWRVDRVGENKCGRLPGEEAAAREPGLGTWRGGDVTGFA